MAWHWYVGLKEGSVKEEYWHDSLMVDELESRVAAVFQGFTIVSKRVLDWEYVRQLSAQFRPTREKYERGEVSAEQVKEALDAAWKG